MNNILSCFFPSTVIAIDDNYAFLNSLEEIISSRNLSFKGFDNPIEALRFINENSKINSLTLSDLIIAGEESAPDWKSVLLNINKLYDEIYNIDRFSKISTVLADYSMPGLNGIELCSKIKNPSIQKILLTGVADERIAIEAFNNGYINRFIKKGSSDLIDNIVENVNKSVYQYFSTYTSDLIKYLPGKEKNYLKDPIFANFFINTCLSKSYVEYYMLDTFGSYLFLTQDGQVSFLSVMPETEMDRVVEIGIDSKEISEESLLGLQSREYMLVSHNRSGLLPPISSWGQYLRPARKLEGYQTYYFSFADGNILDLDFDKIKSFNRFKEKALYE